MRRTCGLSRVAGDRDIVEPGADPSADGLQERLLPRPAAKEGIPAEGGRQGEQRRDLVGREVTSGDILQVPHLADLFDVHAELFLRGDGEQSDIPGVTEIEREADADRAGLSIRAAFEAQGRRCDIRVGSEDDAHGVMRSHEAPAMLLAAKTSRPLGLFGV